MSWLTRLNKFTAWQPFFQESNKYPILFSNCVPICHIPSLNWQKSNWAYVAAWNWGYPKQIFCILGVLSGFISQESNHIPRHFFMELLTPLNTARKHKTFGKLLLKVKNHNENWEFSSPFESLSCRFEISNQYCW